MIPSQSHPINGGGRIDPVWLRWLAQLERDALAGKESGETNAEAIAAIATALGSPDGTVASIPPLSSGGDAITVRGSGSVRATGGDTVAVSLVNDQNFPSASWYYGTDEDGDRGWHSLHAHTLSRLSLGF